MFTGIIEELGIIRCLSRTGDSARLALKSSICYTDSVKGDSISVNGCCLTVIKKDKGMLVFDVSRETLSSSNLADLAEGERVNLERSLAHGGRLGGHFVTGHIDYAGRIISKSVNADFVELSIDIAKDFNDFFVLKGSITVDGVSLTVNRVLENSFKVMLIPHTLSCTTLQYKDKGCRVNIETDILAKYTSSLIKKAPGSYLRDTNINKDFLSEHGFI
jgi:riboflavin synthase